MTYEEVQNIVSDRLADGGPVYRETDLSHFIAEPWNALSSLLYLLPAIWILYRLRGKYREFPFLIYFCVPLLAIGGTGSTLYHAFRASRVLLYMDFVPIALLTMGVSFYFLLRITKHWSWAVIIMLLSFLLRSLGFGNLSHNAAINVSYLITGLLIFVPAIIFLSSTGFRHWQQIALSSLLFGIALTFRYTDMLIPFFKQGTHWLWHLFSAWGAWLLGHYLILVTSSGKTSPVAHKNQV